MKYNYKLSGPVAWVLKYNHTSTSLPHFSNICHWRYNEQGVSFNLTKLILTPEIMQQFWFLLAVSLLYGSIETSGQTISNDPNDVAFYLYPNPANLSDSDVLVYNNAASISSSRYNIFKGSIVLIHGFAQNYTDVFPKAVKDLYLQVGFSARYNIIAVDWGKLATPSPEAAASLPSLPSPLVAGAVVLLAGYPGATSNVPVVTQRIVSFIQNLVDNNFVSSLSNVHIIGMSMGAHVAGGVGAGLQANRQGQVVGRVTGLDPAGPLFQGVAASNRLDATDAAYVDVVHTNQFVFGYIGSLGKADFYVNNGGPFQPGCPLVPQTVADAFCSHGKAIEYYAQSIYTPTLKGCQCLLPGVFCGSNCATFGEYSSPSSSGDYYLSIP